MTALLTLAILAAFGYAIHRFAPKSGAESFPLDHFRTPGPLLDNSASHYEEQRRYCDLAAIHSRFDRPELVAGPIVEPGRAAGRPIPNPSCGTFKASFS
ncbi:hypothetical protein [Nocardia sp. NPDC005366]|uniref:hypothetical protein n=1 Tax=Nocardia sp. NPDC005366 TaxID=3156878 RepID=UPI0033BBB528